MDASMASLRPTPSSDTCPAVDPSVPSTDGGGGRLAGRSARSGGPARFLGAVAASVVAALALTACVGEPPEVTVDDPELVTGRAIYGSNCASCHGASGGGGSGPRLAEGAVVAAYPDIEAQIDLVTNGRDRMPAYVGRLSDDEIRAVVRYTREVL